MLYKRDLKIEFRAVPFASLYHVLECRISPDQDLSYVKEHSFLGIHFKTHHKFSTEWERPEHFFNSLSSYRHDEDDSINFIPFFIHNKEELNMYKEQYKTCGEFWDMYHKVDNENRIEYREKRKEYLENRCIWN